MRPRRRLEEEALALCEYLQPRGVVRRLHFPGGLEIPADYRGFLQEVASSTPRGRGP